MITIFCIILLLLILQLSLGGIHSYLAVCLIVKDDLEYLPEWVEYHRRMGVGKFYIFDHNSSIPLLNSISKYVATGLVDYTYSDFSWAKLPPQLAAYNICLQKHGSSHRFMAFIDSDEFIVVVDKTKRIPDVLRDFEKYGGVALNWMLFGSSGHIEKPPGGVIANYYKCCRNPQVKIITNTQFVHRAGNNPHYFVYKNEYSYLPAVLNGRQYYAVSPNANRTRVTSHLQMDTTTTFDTIYINHYNTRSRSEFLQKISRGRGGMRNPHLYSVDYIDSLDKQAVDTCPILKMPEE